MGFTSLFLLIFLKVYFGKNFYFFFYYLDKNEEKCIDYTVFITYLISHFSFDKCIIHAKVQN